MQLVSEVVALVLGFIALGSAVVGWIRWIRPRVKQRQAERAEDRQRQRDRDVVIFGRSAVPPNPYTGEEGQEEIRPLVQIVREIHHELHPNSGSSMRDAIDRTEGGVAELRSDVAEVKGRLADGDQKFVNVEERLAALEALVSNELVVATDTVANAAEASRLGLQVIDAAIRAEPPQPD